jgi:hypothetical protein
MKTIAELQQEIRNIRKELNNLDDRLNGIDSELVNYKDAPMDNSEYKRLYEIAKMMPKINHPIIAQSLSVRNNYFGILLMIATIDDNLNEGQLLFLQRMILADANNSRLDYYLGNLGSINPENILIRMNEAVKTTFSDQLLLDMMILFNLSSGSTRNACKFVASIATFTGKNKAVLMRISKVAVAVLKQDICDLPTPYQDTIDMDNQFGFYLGEIPGWKERIVEANVAKHKREERNYEGRNVSKTAFFHMSEEEEYGENWIYYKD